MTERTPRKLNQQTGDHSTQNQAGRDLIINGISASDALAIAKEVAQAELAIYDAQAQYQVAVRLEEFQKDFIGRICELDPTLLRMFSEPDVQASLFEAQKSYARTGTPEIRGSLIELIAARCAAPTGGLQAIVIGEAIETIRKVTSAGVPTLAACFVVTNVRNTTINTHSKLTDWFVKNYLPFGRDLPESAAEQAHLIAIGCATRSDVEILLTNVIRATYPGLFQKGLTLNQIPDELLEINSSRPYDPIFIPCLNDPEKLQVRALDKDVAKQQLPEDVDESAVHQYVGFLEQNLMDTPQQVGDTLRSHDPIWGEIISSWVSHPWIKYLRVTSVGTAIGHCYWSNRCDPSSPLDIWIPK